MHAILCGAMSITQADIETINFESLRGVSVTSGVINEDEKFEDPRDLANAYATRLGLKPFSSKTKPDTVKAAYTPYATSLAASR